MSIIEWALMPSGEPAPVGTHDADIATVFTPSGPEGPVHFKASIYDPAGELLGKYVFEATPASTFHIGAALVGQAEALEHLDATDHWVSITVETPGRLSAMVFVGQ